MNRIDESEVQAARETPILEVWNRLNLPPVPRDGGAIRSPFREDKNPSLQVGGPKNIVFDHATGESLDPIQLVRKVLGVTFPEAVAFVLGKPVSALSSNGHMTQPRKPKSSNGSVNSMPGKQIASYQYRDETGSLLFEVLRFDPKGFRQRRPDGKGGWVWNLNGVRRVLYRLPETLEAIRNGEVVFVCEGEKDCETLALMGLHGTCNPGGAGKWSQDYSEALRGARVVILPDNDQPGIEHSETVARSLSRISESVKILPIPDLPPKGDVSDWIEKNGGTKEALERYAEFTPEWTPKIEIPGPGSPLKDLQLFEPFPLHCLPKPIREYVEASSRSIECDPSMIAVFALGCLGSSIGHLTQIRIKADWHEPPLLWVGVVGKSGSGKSPALKAALAPLEEIDRELHEQNARTREDFKQALRAWEVEEKRSKGKNPDPKPERPPSERLIVRDFTLESLGPILLENPRGLLYVADELNRLFKGMNKYNRGKDERDSWNQIFNAQSITIDRKHGDPPTLYIPVAGISVVGGIQPGVLSKTLNSEDWDSGFPARFLFIAPPTKGKRWNESEPSRGIQNRYSEVFRKLRTNPVRRDGEGRGITSFLNLTHEAKGDVWKPFFNDHSEILEAANDRLQAAYAKILSYAARFTLIIHLSRLAAGEAVTSDWIDPQSVQAGCELARWFRSETERVYSVLGESHQAKRRRDLIEWIRLEGGAVTARSLQRRKPSLYPTSEEAESTLVDLVSSGFGEWRDLPPGEFGGRPTREFTLHPHSRIDKTSLESKEGEVLSIVNEGNRSERRLS